MNKANIAILLIIFTLSIFFVLLCFPVIQSDNGIITDWLGNDNGFGLKIDGVTYWLDYANINANVSMPEFRGHYCELTYVSNLLQWQGSPFGYRHIISLIVFDSESK